MELNREKFELSAPVSRSGLILPALLTLTAAIFLLFYAANRDVVTTKTVSCKIDSKKVKIFSDLEAIPVRIGTHKVTFNVFRTIKFLVAGVSLSFIFFCITLVQVLRHPSDLNIFRAKKLPQTDLTIAEIIICLATIIAITSLPGALLHLRGIPDYQVQEWSISYFLLAEVSGILCFVLLVWQRNILKYGIGFNLDKCFTWIKYGFRSFLVYLPIHIIIVVLNMLLFYLATVFFQYEQPGDEQLQVVLSVLENKRFLLFLAFFAVFGAPLLEEILFRGIFYGFLRKHFSVLPAALICGLIFGLVHGSLVKILPIGAIGVLLCLLREKSGSLVAPIVFHSTYNGFVVLTILTFVW